MKTRYYFISAVLLPFALFSCNKAEEATIEVAPTITIHANIPSDNATKVAAVVPEGGKGLDWNWETGDQIAVNNGKTASVFDIRSGFEPKSASFTGKLIEGDAFSILYPGTITSYSAMQAMTLTDQQQVGNDVKTQLKYFAAMNNVDDYNNFEFSQEWAAAHGGTLLQCGVVRFELTLPAETQVVNRITLKAGAPVFHNGNSAEAVTDEITIGLSEVTLGADKTVIAWMNTSWNDDKIPAGTALTVSVAAGDLSWNADITPAADKTIKAGYVNKITVGESQWVSGGRYAEGSGTEEDPWIIKTPAQLTYMRDDIASKELRYFKLEADLNMEGIEWVPLNNVNDPSDETKAYDKFVYFDGAGHTISNLTITNTEVAYPSFAGVLYGTIKNVTFNQANINAGNNKAGVVAGYVGTSQAYTGSSIINVTVKNSEITASRHVGAFVGQVVTKDSYFENCHVQNSTVNGAEYAAGFAGYIQDGKFVNCSAEATISGTKHVGGFVGKTEVPVFEACSFEGGVITVSATGSNQSGGFVGYAGKVDNVGAQFNKCYVKNASLKMSSGQRIGGFTGQADLGTIFFKCYVKDTDIEGATNTGGFVGVDYATPSDLVPEGGIYQCYVDGGSLTASNANPGGFVGYPEKATIKNCFSTMNVNGGSFACVGGFIGICKKNVTVQYCYAAGTVEGSAATVGGFVGRVDGDATSHINSCIAWTSALPFSGQTAATADVTNNYCGTEGTLSARAAELGWDPTIWNFNATLRSILR